jgi:hypothetical protein
MPQQETRDIEQIASGLRPLLRAEAESRFAIGDYLIENNHLRPSEMKRLAELVSREKSTLEAYLKVSTVFPPSRRNYKVAWGVFKQLSRVEDEEWQDEYLAQHPGATTTPTERAVNAKLLADRGTDKRPRQRWSDRAWVPGVDVDVAVFGEKLASGMLTLNGDLEKAELVFSEVHGQWRVEFTLRQPEGD